VAQDAETQGASSGCSPESYRLLASPRFGPHELRAVSTRLRRLRRPCGSRPEGLAQKCRRALRSRVPRTPTFRPEACRARLAWRSERPRTQRRRRCRQTRCAFCLLLLGHGQPSHFGGTLRQRCCETSDPARLSDPVRLTRTRTVRTTKRNKSASERSRFWRVS
jgi:hypothetical protein